MSEKTISCADAINEIAETLIEADGEFITNIYNQVCTGEAEYEGDNLIKVRREI